MGCSIHVIWIISIKEHCFFNYIIFFWPIFLFINFLHSFHLTYKLSPASLPKKFTRLYENLFEPIKLSKKEFKILTQHSLVINLNKGENYLVENESPITEKVGILLEGKLDVLQNDIFLHHIFPNDFIDSPEFKYIELYSENEQLSKQQTRPSDSKATNVQTNRTCSNCKQVLIEIDSSTNKSNDTSQPINLSMNNKLSSSSCIRSNERRKKSVSESHPPTKHPKNCVLNHQMDNNRSKTTRATKNRLSIDSPLKEKIVEFGSVNKLAQVTITASENCKLLCWKRDLLVNDTLSANPRLKVIFSNLVGKDIINKLYLVNEQRTKQQQTIGESQDDQQQTNQMTPIFSKLLAHNPLKGDNLLSKFREINLLNAYPYIPHESMMYLSPYNRNLNIGLMNQEALLKQSADLLPAINPYLNY